MSQTVGEMVIQKTESVLIGVNLFIGLKVLCMFCFKFCAPEGRREEKGGSANFKTNSPVDIASKAASISCKPECYFVAPINHPYPF